MIDTHAHLDYFEPAELPEVLARAHEAGVGRIITIGTNVSGSRRAIEIAAAHEDVYASVGVHPHDAAALDAAAGGELALLARADRVVAIGETGLDYHQPRSHEGIQKTAFEFHIELAALVDLPLVIHCRDAFEDLKTILAATRPRRAVLHCFSGGPAEAEEFLAMGCYISFSGTVTFSNAPRLREAAALVPLDRLLTETDCPYLTPHPHRGERNEPAYVKLIVEKLAEVKGRPIEKVVKETTANAETFFCL